MDVTEKDKGVQDNCRVSKFYAWVVRGQNYHLEDLRRVGWRGLLGYRCGYR